MGTLNLYLETPDAMQKTKNWSDHPGLRKRPKTAKKITLFDFVQFSTVFGRFLSPGWSDQFFVFCIASGVTRYKFRVPTKGTLEKLFFWLIKGSALSSGPFQIRFRASDFNFVFCVCSPKPNRTFLEPRQIRYWKNWFFNTPYCAGFVVFQVHFISTQLSNLQFLQDFKQSWNS